MFDARRPAELNSWPTAVGLPVQWGDMDAYGHVNNMVALRWFETARIAYIRQYGIDQLLSQLGLAPIVASITCNYRRQIKFPDNVLAAARVSEVGASSMQVEQLIFSQQQNAAVWDGVCTVVVFDYQAQRPRRIPPAVREAIATHGTQ